MLSDISAAILASKIISLKDRKSLCYPKALRSLGNSQGVECNIDSFHLLAYPFTLLDLFFQFEGFCFSYIVSFHFLTFAVA